MRRLHLYYSQKSEDRFSHVEAHIKPEDRVFRDKANFIITELQHKYSETYLKRSPVLNNHMCKENSPN